MFFFLMTEDTILSKLNSHKCQGISIFSSLGLDHLKIYFIAVLSRVLSNNTNTATVLKVRFCFVFATPKVYATPTDHSI